MNWTLGFRLDGTLWCFPLVSTPSKTDEGAAGSRSRSKRVAAFSHHWLNQQPAWTAEVLQRCRTTRDWVRATVGAQSQFSRWGGVKNQIQLLLQVTRDISTGEQWRNLRWHGPAADLNIWLTPSLTGNRTGEQVSRWAPGSRDCQRFESRRWLSQVSQSL